MKNLPDKIYLSFGEMSEDKFEKEDYKEFCEQHNNLVDFLKNKFWETDVEYTCTDVFIEKAWDWIENNILSPNQQDESFLYYEQFKNYMKGESGYGR